jgi:hypothetical protein
MPAIRLSEAHGTAHCPVKKACIASPKPSPPRAHKIARPMTNNEFFIYLQFNL